MALNVLIVRKGRAMPPIMRCNKLISWKNFNAAIAVKQFSAALSGR